MNMINSWKQKAKLLKTDVIALYYAYRDQRVPWYAKLFIVLVVSYAFSPIDLIPDFIPILGYLDDLVLIPLGVALAMKMIPSSVMNEARAKVKDNKVKPKKWLGALVIVVIWVILLIWIFHAIMG